MKKILFLHGFFATGSCPMARALREAFDGQAVVLTPDLPLHPKEALKYIRMLIDKEKPDLLIGNSCGAFLAQMLSPVVGIPALLGNPHFKMTDFLRERIGELNEQREQSIACSGYAESREKKTEGQLEDKSIRRKRLMYLHGFGSSAASGTVKTLRELLPDFDVVAPDIPVDPAEALPFLRGLCMNEVPDVIVGTSMGGMYAQQMRGYNRICVNPSFEMSKKSKMLTVGTHEYFKPRKDGTTHFEITPEIIRHHAEMEEQQFDGITEEDRTQVWGMFADNDQQVNGESLFLQYYNQVVHFSGEHRMDDKVIENVLVPLIRTIVK